MPAFERQGEGEDLVDASRARTSPPSGGRAVAGSSSSAGAFGLASGSETATTISPVLTSSTSASRRDRRILLHGALQLLGHGMLRADVERKPHRGFARARRILAPARCSPLSSSMRSMPASPRLSSVNRAQHMAGERAQRIDPLQLGAEAEARQAQLVDALGVPRAQAARHPDEAPALVGRAAWRSSEALRLGSTAVELLDRLVEVLDQLRIGIERRHAQGRWRAAARCDRRCRAAPSRAS